MSTSTSTILNNWSHTACDCFTAWACSWCLSTWHKPLPSHYQTTGTANVLRGGKKTMMCRITRDYKYHDGKYDIASMTLAMIINNINRRSVLPSQKVCLILQKSTSVIPNLVSYVSFILPILPKSTNCHIQIATWLQVCFHEGLSSTPPSASHGTDLKWFSQPLGVIMAWPRHDHDHGSLETTISINKLNKDDEHPALFSLVVFADTTSNTPGS